jgi:hypothetical protein
MTKEVPGMSTPKTKISTRMDNIYMRSNYINLSVYGGVL